MIPSLEEYGLYEQEGALRLLPETWDDALAAECSTHVGRLWFESQEVVLQRLTRDEGIAFVRRITYALITEGIHSVLGNVEKPGPSAKLKERQRFKRSEEALTFTQGWVARQDYSLKALTVALCEFLCFGHKLAEGQLEDFTLEDQPFKGKTFVAPVDLSPKPRTVYRFQVDNANRVQGVRPNNSETIVPVSNLLWVSAPTGNRDPRGGDGAILPTLYRTVARKINAEKQQDEAARQSGGGFLAITQEFPPASSEDPVNTIEVPNPAYTEGGSEPKTKTVSKLKVAATEARKARTGGVATFAAGQKPQMVQASGAEVFDAILDRADRAIVRAYLGAARSLLEAQNGSKADTGEAADVGLTMRDSARGIICAAIEAFFARVLKLNFGDKYADVCPRYDVTTEEGTDLGAISNFFQANFDKLTDDQKNWLAAKIGMPEFPETTPEEQAAKDAESERIAAEEDERTEQEVAAFVATFPQDDSLITFASQLDRSNGAAQKRVDGAVRSADRQFRSLVKSLGKGTRNGQAFGAPEFNRAFSYTLSVAHDRAYSLGFAHAGGDGLSEAGQNYLAETVGTEADFAASLAEDLLSGKRSLNKALADARQYAQRVRGTANVAFAEGSVGSGETLTWTLGGNEDHCASCPELAGLSPWEPDQMFQYPGDGKSECRSNCLCRLVRSDGKEGFGPASFA